MPGDVRHDLANAGFERARRHIAEGTAISSYVVKVQYSPTAVSYRLVSPNILAKSVTSAFQFNFTTA
jgi:hypothetical protein